MGEERFELQQRERDRLKVWHELENGDLKQREADERLVKHGRYYWLLLVESHLTRPLFWELPAKNGGAPITTGHYHVAI